MPIERTMSALRRHPTLSGLACVATVAIAIGIRTAFPHLPPFITLIPAVLVSAAIGGKWAGRLALVVCTLAAIYFLRTAPQPESATWQVASVVGFVLVASLIVFTLEQLETAIARLQLQKRKLDLVLQAAGAATWEIYPDRRLAWDENFYQLIGLKGGAIPPSSDQFLEMVHPEDRSRMREARDLMNQNLAPRAKDEYRLYKPDGTMIWMENHRIRGTLRDYLVIGNSQDVTAGTQA